MKRVLFVTIALLMLLGSFSTAFAGELQRVNQEATPALLGEVWWFYFDFGLAGLRVDAYLYRPATEIWDPVNLEWDAYWPFAGGPLYGTWWWMGPESEQRRQSWPAYQYTDVWGFYYAEFMFPRENTWYPCGFPLQWQCNYVVDPFGTIEWHSPAAMAYECRWVSPTIIECLNWPWVVDPMDTVAPMEVYLIDEFGSGYIIPFEVLGMFWKFSDFE
jgi:hypothetical protein